MIKIVRFFVKNMLELVRIMKNNNSSTINFIDTPNQQIQAINIQPSTSRPRNLPIIHHIQFLIRIAIPTL